MYILILTVHTKDMETNSKTTASRTTKKKENPMKKVTKSIKDAFIEMSSSLAGWIDDTSTQFSRKKKKVNKTPQPTMTPQKSMTTQTHKPSSTTSYGPSSQTSNS